MKVLSLFSGMGGFDLGLELAGMEIVAQAEYDPTWTCRGAPSHSWTPPLGTVPTSCPVFRDGTFRECGETRLTPPKPFEEQDCNRVLAHHWPNVRRLGDVRHVIGDHRFGGTPRPEQPEGGWGGQPDRDTVGRPDEMDPSGQRHGANAEQREPAGRAEGAVHIDLICGGFPCQDVSVAGKRAGLDGGRSGLWFEFHRIVSEVLPKYVLVENVPGLLSSNGGRDFVVIVDGLGELGYDVSWAVLDSQHFGVPQRRRRVFIVAGPPDGRTEAILAIAEGCAGHLEAGRTPGEDAAGEAEGGVAKPLGGGSGERGWMNDLDALAIRTAQTGANGIGVQADQAYTLDGTDGQAVAYPTYAIQERAVEGEGTSGPDGIGVREGTAYTLEARPKVQMAAYGASVRRLTPTECLRLQAFPDDWLDLEPPLSDGAKYRMCGNAVTVPVIEWIGRRMLAVETEW